MIPHEQNSNTFVKTIENSMSTFDKTTCHNYKISTTLLKAFYQNGLLNIGYNMQSGKFCMKFDINELSPTSFNS